MVARTVEQAFAAFGGAGKFAWHGCRVLVKPNLLLAVPPERAVTTHPAVVHAVVSLLRDAGAHVTIGDSPGLVRGTTAAERAGISAVAHRLGARVVDFDDSVEVATPPGFMFRKIEIARAVIEADAIINLPKFKTHGQMVLTMATKNYFGCVVGRRKAQWHMAAGRDPDTFARLLVELSLLAAPPDRPRFNLVDGVIGMDGNGPSSGRVRPVGVILAGEDPVAVDRAAARLVGLPEERFPLLRAARAVQAYAGKPEPLEVVGDPLDQLALRDFVLPPGVHLQWTRFRWLRRALKRAAAARPHVDRSKCEACGVCTRSCPPQAMTIAGGNVRIDRALCISCFCCQELCPRHAISVRRGWLAELTIPRRRTNDRPSRNDAFRDSGR